MPKVIGRVHAQIDSDFSLQKIGQFFNRRKTFNESWFVLADNINQFEDDIVSAPDLPSIGSILGGGFLIRKQAKEQATVPAHPITGVQTTLWIVTCYYDSQIDQDQINQNADPTQRRPKRKWRNVKENVLIDKDVNNKPLTTQAGEKIHYEDPKVFPILEIERYESFPYNVDRLAFEDSCNAGNLQIAGKIVKPGNALLEAVESEEVTIGMELYESVRYLIRFSPGAFDPDTPEDQLAVVELLHQGFLYINPDTVDLTPTTFLDKNGTPQRANLVYDPQGSAFDGFNGGRILPASSDPDFIPFQPKEKKDWTSLNFDY